MENNRNKLKVSDFIGGMDEVFNPEFTFDGTFVVPVTVFSYNGKIDGNGHNMFNEYFNNRYVSKLMSVFSNLKLMALPPLSLESRSNKDYGRSLDISLDLLLTQLCINILGMVPDCLASDINGFDFDKFRDEIKDLRIQINNMIKDDDELVDKELIENIKLSYLSNERVRRSRHKFDYRPLPYKEYLELVLGALRSLSADVRYLKGVDLSVNPKDIDETVDLDRAYLACVYHIIDYSKTIIKNEGAVHNSFIFVEKYIRTVESIRSKCPYKLSVKVKNYDGRELSFSVDDAIREYNKIKVENPEFQVAYVPITGEDYRNVNNAKSVSDKMEEERKLMQLYASWDIIKAGNRPAHAVDLTSPIKLSKAKGTKFTLDQERAAIVDRRNFLEALPYGYRIKGKNNFAGYEGYIFGNKIVVFEKFYKDIDTKEPSVSNATYVMSFNNFVELSKKTKSEIIEYIKCGGSDVRRFYHSKSWKRNILNAISGCDYSKEVMERINGLLNDGVLKNKVK